MTHVTINLDQVGFRGRNDDGSETLATWIAAENTNWTQDINADFRIRFVVDETAGGAENNVEFRLQYQLNGGGWNNVDASTSLVVRAQTSSHFNDGDPTTRQLTSGSGTFEVGAMSETGLASNTIDFAGDEVTEIEYCIQIRGADVSDNDTVELRVVRDGGTLEAWTQTPSITVNVPPPTNHQLAAQVDGAAAVTAFIPPSPAPIIYNHDLSRVEADSTTWVDVCRLSASSFNGGDTYLLLFNAFAKADSSANEIGIRLAHGATPTVFTDASLAAEVAGSGAGGNQEANFSLSAAPFTQPGTPEEIVLQANIQTSGLTTVVLGQIVAINLSDLGVDGTDYHSNEVTADHTTNATKTAQASVTFTPNGTDDYLIIASASITPGSNTDDYLMDVNDSVDGVLAAITVEGEDPAAETRGHMLMAVFTPTNVSHTISVRFSHETTASTVLSSRIIAIPLNLFAQHAFSRATAADTPPAASWGTTRTVSITPDSTREFLYWGYYGLDINTLGNEVATRLQVNRDGGGLVSDPLYGDTAPAEDGWDSGNITPVNLLGFGTLNSGASRTINLDVNHTVGTGAQVVDRTLFVVSKELAGTAVNHQLAAVVNATTTTTASIIAAFDLAAQVDGAAATTALLAVNHPLAGVVNASTSTTTALSLAFDLAAQVDGASAVTANIIAAFDLAAQVGATASTTAALAVSHPLAAAINSASTVTANIIAAFDLAAQVDAVTTVTANLETSAGVNHLLAAVVNSTSTVTAALTADHPLAAQADAVTTITANLTAAHPLAAVVNSASTVTANIIAAFDLAAQVDSAGSVTATLIAAHPLAAVVNSASTVTANIIAAFDLAAQVDAVTTVTANLQTSAGGVNHLLAALVDSAATTTASLTAAHPLAAQVNAVTATTATLIAAHPLAAQVDAIMTASADAAVGRGLAASVNGATSLTVAVTATHPLAVVVNGAGSLLGALRLDYTLAATIGGAGSVTIDLNRIKAAFQIYSTVTLALAHEVALALALKHDVAIEPDLKHDVAIEPDLKHDVAIEPDLKHDVSIEIEGGNP